MTKYVYDYDPSRIVVHQIGNEYCVVDNGDVIETFASQAEADAAAGLYRVDRENHQIAYRSFRAALDELRARGLSKKRARDIIQYVVAAE